MGFETHIESGVAVVREIDGRKVRFGMLDMRDFGTLRGLMPDDERKGALFGDVWAWAHSPIGIIWTVTLAGQKYDPLFSEAQAVSLYVARPLYRLASEILAASNPPDDEAEGGAEGNAETPTGPSASPS